LFACHFCPHIADLPFSRLVEEREQRRAEVYAINRLMREQNELRFQQYMRGEGGGGGGRGGRGEADESVGSSSSDDD
jgi:hypothetical protein